MASKEVMLWRNITLLCSRGPRKRHGWSWSIWGPPPPLTPLGSPLHPVPDPPQHCTRDPISHPPMVPTKPRQHRDTPDPAKGRGATRGHSPIQGDPAQSRQRRQCHGWQCPHFRGLITAIPTQVTLRTKEMYSSSQEEARERTQAVLDESQADKLREKGTSKM